MERAGRGPQSLVRLVVLGRTTLTQEGASLLPKVPVPGGRGGTSLWEEELTGKAAPSEDEHLLVGCFIPWGL